MTRQQLAWISLIGLAATMAVGCGKKTKGGVGQVASTAKSSGVKAAPASTLPKTDQGKLTASAAKVVRFFKYKDTEALVLMSPPKAREKMTKQLEEGSEQYKSLFGDDSWRLKAASAWDEKIGTVRVKGSAALVQFGQDDKYVFAVAFEKVGGNWWFDDIERKTKEEFKAWGTAAK